MCISIASQFDIFPKSFIPCFRYMSLQSRLVCHFFFLAGNLRFSANCPVCHAHDKDTFQHLSRLLHFATGVTAFRLLNTLPTASAHLKQRSEGLGL